MALSRSEGSCLGGHPQRYRLRRQTRLRALLDAVPGVAYLSGLDVDAHAVRIRALPWSEVCISRDAITRVWKLTDREPRIPLRLLSRVDRGGVWWSTGSHENLVAIDVDPPACGRTWGYPIRPRRVVVSLEDPERFIADLLG